MNITIVRLGILLNATILISIFGLVLQLNLNVNGVRIFTFSSLFLIILTIAQSIISFSLIKGNYQLKFLSVLINLTFSFCIFLLLIKYEMFDINNSFEVMNLLYLIGTITFTLMSVCLLTSYKKIALSDHKTFFKKNIFYTWLFILVFGSLPIIISAKSFYNLFNIEEGSYMTYEHYISNKDYYVLYIASKNKYRLKEGSRIGGRDVLGEIVGISSFNKFYLFECFIKKGGYIPVGSKLCLVQTSDEKKDDQILVISSDNIQKYRDYDTLYNFNEKNFSNFMNEEIFSTPKVKKGFRLYWPY